MNSEQKSKVIMIAFKLNTHEIYIGIKSLKVAKPEYNSEMQSY